MTIEDMYADVVEYAKYLEKILLNRGVDEDELKQVRRNFIKPATNIAEEWLGEDRS